MKFKRNIATFLKENQKMTVPNDEVWSVSFVESIGGGNEAVMLADTNTSSQRAYALKNVRLGGVLNLR